MKHIQIKITKTQYVIIYAIKKEGCDWIKITTNHDIVYFSEDRLVEFTSLLKKQNGRGTKTFLNKVFDLSK